MCIYAFCFSISKIKIKKHLTNTISLFKRMQIITRKTAQEPRKIERGRIKERIPPNMPWDAGAEMSPVQIALRRPQNPMRQWLKERERVREGWVGGRSRLSDAVSFASHRGLLGVVVFGFPHTLCPYERRLSSPRRIRFREGRGTPGWTPSQCLSLGACSLAPWEEKSK